MFIFLDYIPIENGVRGRLGVAGTRKLLTLADTRMDPVESRVAIPAADPPDNAKRYRHSGDGRIDWSLDRDHIENEPVSPGALI